MSRLDATDRVELRRIFGEVFWYDVRDRLARAIGEEFAVLGDEKPRIFAENVLLESGLEDVPLDTILLDLENSGYRIRRVR